MATQSAASHYRHHLTEIDVRLWILGKGLSAIILLGDHKYSLVTVSGPIVDNRQRHLRSNRNMLRTMIEEFRNVIDPRRIILSRFWKVSRETIGLVAIVVFCASIASVAAPYLFPRISITGALLYRLTHHTHILTMSGDTYRLKQSAGRTTAAASNKAKQNQAITETVDTQTGKIAETGVPIQERARSGPFLCRIILTQVA